MGIKFNPLAQLGFDITGSSGGGGGGASTDLSNLTSPTAINQSLLFGTDNSKSIGATGASRPSNIFAAGSIRPAFGSASAAAFGFDGEINTGFYRSAAGEVSFTSAGTQQIKLFTDSFGGGAITIPSELGGLQVGGAPTDPGTSGNTIVAASSLYNAGYLARAAGTGNVPVFGTAQSRGTLASPTFTLSSDQLGLFRWSGNNSSTTFAEGAAIFAVATANWTSSLTPTDVIIRTTNTVSGTPTFKDTFRVTSSGDIKLMPTSATNLLWNTDGAGSIGASGASRPNNLFLKSFYEAAEIATPSNPPASNHRVYFKSDGNLYTLNSAGSEVQITSLSSITGPGTSTDRAISTWNGTAGAALRDNSTVLITSAGDLSTSRNRIIIGANGNMALTDSTAFASRTSGTLNTGFGSNVFNGLTTGQLNTAIGWGNMTGTVTGNNNAVLGVGIFTGTTMGGTGNVAIGYTAMTSATAAAQNVAVGTGALSNISSSSAAINNVAIGSGAGATVNGVTTGNDNTYIGANTGNHGAIGTFNIAIGSGADISSTVANNELVIGGAGGGSQKVVIGQGWTNATPLAVVLNTTSGTGSNIAGANLTVQPGNGTGTGVGGELIVKTAPAGTTGSSANSLAERMRIDNKGNVTVGIAALATTATDGFLYIPTCAGTPTGTPTTKTGLSSLVIDTVGNQICFYNAGAWHCIPA